MADHAVLRAPDRRCLYQDVCQGAALAGEKPPSEHRVNAVAELLSEVGETCLVPADLVSSLTHVLVKSAARPSSLWRGVWAEARFLPLSFALVEVIVLVAAVLLNHYVAGFWGPGPFMLLSPAMPDAEAVRFDASTLVAPLLGLVAVLSSLVPTYGGSWADLEEMSLWPRSLRLFLRTVVTALVPLLGAIGLSAVDAVRGDPAAPGSVLLSALLLLVARTAPLLLTVSWALVWAVRFGWIGAMVSTSALWLAQFAITSGGTLPRLLAVPQTWSQAAPQYVAIGFSLGLLAWVACRQQSRSCVGARWARGTGRES